MSIHVLTVACACDAHSHGKIDSLMHTMLNVQRDDEHMQLPHEGHGHN